jgi:hypothetical protein
MKKRNGILRIYDKKSLSSYSPVEILEFFEGFQLDTGESQNGAQGWKFRRGNSRELFASAREASPSRAE